MRSTGGPVFWLLGTLLGVALVMTVLAPRFFPKAAAAPAEPASALRIVTATSDPALWSQIERTLHIDPARKDLPRNVLQWAGVSGGAVLAFVARVEFEPDIGSLTKAYSLPLSGDSFDELASNETFLRVQLERVIEPTGLAPTAVFSAYSCVECEPLKLLEAFAVDAAAKRWTRVHWLLPEPRDALGLDQVADEGWNATTCAVGVVGSDLGIWCHYHDEPDDAGHFTTERYVRRGGDYVRTEVGEPEAKALRIALCKDPLPSAHCPNVP